MSLVTLALQACAEPLPLSVPERQQSPLPHHARAHHQGECVPGEGRHVPEAIIRHSGGVKACSMPKAVHYPHSHNALLHGHETDLRIFYRVGNRAGTRMQAPQHAAAQVLNMKPQEILGMLEEAAGTRMYETKKEAALRTLEKKQVKVQEIEKVLFPVRLTQEHFAWQGLPIPIDLRVLSKQAERLLSRPCLTYMRNVLSSLSQSITASRRRQVDLAPG